jgi:hypothetical protein
MSHDHCPLFNVIADTENTASTIVALRVGPCFQSVDQFRYNIYIYIVRNFEIYSSILRDTEFC